MNNFPTSYEFACGAVHRWENKFLWVEMYMEHGVYHVRRGIIGGKWISWRSYDKTIPSRFRAAKKKFKSFVRISKDLSKGEKENS